MEMVCAKHRVGSDSQLVHSSWRPNSASYAQCIDTCTLTRSHTHTHLWLQLPPTCVVYVEQCTVTLFFFAPSHSVEQGREHGVSLAEHLKVKGVIEINPEEFAFSQHSHSLAEHLKGVL